MGNLFMCFLRFLRFTSSVTPVELSELAKTLYGVGWRTFWGWGREKFWKRGGRGQKCFQDGTSKIMLVVEW